MKNRILRAVYFTLAFPLVVASVPALSIRAEAVPSIGAAAACLIESESGDVLYAKRENERRGMASTTKIMTAVLAIEALPLETPITIREDCCHIEGSSLYLRAGEVLSLEDLLFGLLLRSANDAAMAIATAVDGSPDAFVARMNKKAEELSLVDTHFDNPHGLDGPTHYTTARELALLGAYCMKNPTFRRIVSTKRHTIAKGTESQRLLINHNRMLTSYDGAIGIKTGFTKKCGRTLICAAEREGVTLIAVTLDAPNDWQDHARMLDYGFHILSMKTILAPHQYTYELPILGAPFATLTVYNEEAVSRIQRQDEKPPVIDVVLPRYLIAPLKKGDRVGEIRVRYPDGTKIVLPIVAAADAPFVKTKKHFSLF